MPEPILSQSIQLALASDNLTKLTPQEQVEYYNAVCLSVGLNPLTQPLAYTLLNGKLRLYAKKDATDQLRRIYKVSVDSVDHDHKEPLGLYIVKSQGHNAEGRTDSATGAVSVKGLTGESLANAIMKAESKSKRRFTLSICGLGMLDESELETVEGTVVNMPPPLPAIPAAVDHTPALPTEDARPEESPKKGRKTKSTAVIEAQVAAEAVVGGNPPDEGFKATDDDLPANLQDTPTDREPTQDERNSFVKKVRTYYDSASSEQVGKYILAETGASSSGEITLNQWTRVFDKMDVALAEGKGEFTKLIAEAA